MSSNLSVPTINRWLRSAANQLKKAGIGSGDLDALILLEDELGVDRAQLLAAGDRPISYSRYLALQTRLRRRVKHEPLAYVRGKTEFYGRQFLVDERVLEPRPESETMISLLLAAARPLTVAQKRQLIVVDVGTGSGALAITAKLEVPHWEVSGTDIDRACLMVARRNARRLGAKVRFGGGDLLAAVQEADIILANLPYVPDGWQINQAAGWEPRTAIFGGGDGLDIYRRLFGQFQALRRHPRLIFTETLPPQHPALAAVAQKHGFRLRHCEDFIQCFEPAP